MTDQHENGTTDGSSNLNSGLFDILSMRGVVHSVLCDEQTCCAMWYVPQDATTLLFAFNHSNLV